jgi:hypothetical protein
MVTGAYRKDDFSDADGFAVQAATLAETYTDEAIERVTNAVTGIQTQCKFPPTLAELKDHLEHEQVRIARIADMSKGTVSFKRAFEPRTDPGCWANVLVHKDAPQYAEMVAKAFERDADIREYRYCPQGIWVTRIWLGHDVIR